jgi:hypothetical protein
MNAYKLQNNSLMNVSKNGLKGRDEIKAIINQAFNVDKKGEISTTKVLGLKRIEIDHPNG